MTDKSEQQGLLDDSSIESGRKSDTFVRTDDTFTSFALTTPPSTAAMNPLLSPSDQLGIGGGLPPPVAESEPSGVVTTEGGPEEGQRMPTTGDPNSSNTRSQEHATDQVWTPVEMPLSGQVGAENTTDLPHPHILSDLEAPSTGKAKKATFVAAPDFVKSTQDFVLSPLGPAPGIDESFNIGDFRSFDVPGDGARVEASSAPGIGEGAEDRGFEQDEYVDLAQNVPLRDKIYFLFDGVPQSLQEMEDLIPLLPWSKVIVNFTMFLVLVSCIGFSVETLPQYHQNTPVALVIIEVICVSWFTIDLLVRFTSVRNKLDFVLTAMNWIDFLSVLPFYIGVIAGDEQGATVQLLVMLRVLRLARAIRVFKLSKSSKGLQTVTESVRRSTGALSLLGFLLFVMLIIFASVFYFTEQLEQTWNEERRLWIRDADGTVSPFQSIIHSMWFSVVTITTTGYGDDNPYSPLTKCAAVGLMLTAAFVIAFPTVVLSANFHDVHSAAHLTDAELEKKYYRESVIQGTTNMDRRERGMRIAEAQLRGADIDEDDAPKKETAAVTGGTTATSKQQGSDDNGADFAFMKAATDNNESGVIVSDSPPAGITVSPAEEPEEDPAIAAAKKKAANLRKNFPRSKVVSLLRNRSVVQRASVVLQYTLGGSAPPREIYVFNQTKSALFAPVLMFRCGSRDGEANYGPNSDTRARLSLRHNFPEGFTASFTLLLQTKQAMVRAREALNKADGGKYKDYTLEPAKIKKLTTLVHSSHALLHNALLTTGEYIEPYGSVPIEVFVPKLDALTVLLRYSGSMVFTFVVEYDSGEIYTLCPGQEIRGVSVIESWTSSRTQVTTTQGNREFNGEASLITPSATLLSEAQQQQLLMEQSMQQSRRHLNPGHEEEERGGSGGKLGGEKLEARRKKSRHFLFAIEGSTG